MSETQAPVAGADPRADGWDADVKILRDFADVICPKLRDTLVPFGATGAGWDAASAHLRRIADDLPALRAAAARGAEGERGVEELCDELRSAYAALRTFGRHQLSCAKLTPGNRWHGKAACDCGFVASLAPRPSAGPARCGDCDGCMTGGACTGAARPSDDPAPTTEVEHG